jgi:hypothetical protein
MALGIPSVFRVINYDDAASAIATITEAVRVLQCR